jgi:hypothetical protein
LEQTRAERVVPKPQVPSTSAPGPQAEILRKAEDDWTPRTARTTTRSPRTNNTTPASPEDIEQPQSAAEKQEQSQPAAELQVPKTAEVGGSAKPGEEVEPLAPAIEEILGHYEEESRFCGTRSYTVEIPVGDEVGVIEVVGKIFLEEVKVSLT